MLDQLPGVSKVITKNGEVELSQILSEPNLKFIGVYFSAHWCPPCKAFTPVLA